MSNSCYKYHFYSKFISEIGYTRIILRDLISSNLSGKPTGKRPLGRPRRRWEDNIRMGLKEIGINAGNCVDSAQDRDY